MFVTWTRLVGKAVCLAGDPATWPIGETRIVSPTVNVVVVVVVHVLAVVFVLDMVFALMT